MKKRLYRNENNAVLAGVCEGIGEYTKIDPVIIRLIWVIITVLTSIIPGILVYIVAIIIIPKKPKNMQNPLKRTPNI